MPSRRASTGCSRTRALVRLLDGGTGQGTLEYALVAFAFAGLLAALGALWHSIDGGSLVQHALQSASHRVASVAPGAFADVFMY